MRKENLNINTLWNQIEQEINKVKIDDVKIEHSKIILFGIGAYANEVSEYLKDNNIKISYYCDNNIEKQGKVIDGITVLEPDEINNIEDAFVFITGRHWIKEIKDQLKNYKCEYMGFDTYIVAKHYKQFEEVSKLFDDNKSKETYASILLKMITGDNKYIEQIQEDKAFFAIQQFRYTANDIFLDAGAYVGDTVEQFIWNSLGQFKKIYAFEPGRQQFQAMTYRKERLIKEWGLKENQIVCVEAGLGQEDAYLNYRINSNNILGNYFTADTVEVSKEDHLKKVCSVDSYLAGAPITFLKSDIEGYEMNMLRGAIQTIKKYRPKLAISVYHKPDDLFVISSFVKSIVPEYHFALRNHSNKLMDTVLYCWI